MTSLAALWLSEPAWMAMDATARGFHTHLLLVAARAKPAGVLPDDDAKWRKWLGLPAATSGQEPLLALAKERKKGGSRGALPDALVSGWQNVIDGGPVAKTAARGGAEAWIEYLWTTSWRPQVLAAWTRVDDAFVAEHPELSEQIGAWWSPVAAAMGDSARATALPAKNTKSRKPKGRRPTHNPIALLAEGHGEPANERLLALDLDTGPWREIAVVLGAWRAPVTSEARQTLWDLGVSLLTPSSKSPADARSFLGRLIKKHGEEAVAQAVADLGRRPIGPADARSFLQGILTRAQDGSAAEQRARAARAQVAL